ncbi:MAG: hypothetical protein Q9209_004033 [Squamulea sp. 1 TL-2023]
MELQSPKRSWTFHFYTLWLFTKSDFKTVIAPTTIFACCCGLAEAAKAPDCDLRSGVFELLKRLPYVIIWNWANLLIEDIANQRLPASVLEDALNKPWRPIPAKRISPDESRHLLILWIPLVCFFSWLLGVAQESTAVIVMAWMYNDLGGSSDDWFIRNALNAIALTTWYAAATVIILKRNGSSQLTEQTWVWLCAVGATIMTTVQTQDLPDMHGDSAIRRKTMPLVFGEKFTRWLTAALIIMWSFICPALCDVNVKGYVAIMLVGVVLAIRMICYTSTAADRFSWKLWCFWMVALFTLPAYRVLST